MASNSAKTPRMIPIADSLWRAFEEMEEAMGSDREGLINQAMFMFARLNGFAITGHSRDVYNPPISPEEPTDQSHLREGEETRNHLKDEVSTARKYIGISMEDVALPAACGLGPLFLVSEEGRRD